MYKSGGCNISVYFMQYDFDTHRITRYKSVHIQYNNKKKISMDPDNVCLNETTWVLPDIDKL